MNVFVNNKTHSSEPPVIETERVSPPSAPAVRSQLEKIISSDALKAAKRQSGFLRYVVEEALAGRSEAIKEYTIGVEVFGRGESFDPRISNLVRVEAQRLRSKLAKYYETEGKDDPLCIQLPKGGYAPRFIDNVHPPALPTKVFSSRNRSWRVPAAIAILLLSLAALWAERLWRTRASDPPSLVVLPFVNLSGDKDDEYFSDGLTDELIASLSRIPRLRVVARGSAFQFKGQNFDVREIGRKLNVRSVLEGSIRRSAGRVRVAVHLDDAANGYRVWSNIFEGDSSDVLGIQREVSQALVTSLRAQFAGEWRSEPGAAHLAIAPDAYQAYLKGLYFWNKNSAQNIRTAISYFQEALAKDPNYAPIYTGLGRCYIALPAFTSVSTDEMIPKIRAVASKALALDPNSGEAHLELGQAAFFEFDWGKAEQELKLAVELSPSDPVVHRWRSYYFGRVGRLDEALAETTAAQDLDPVSPYMAEGVAESLRRLRRFNEAIQQSQKALALDPNFGMALRGLGLAYVYKGMYPEGISLLQRAAAADSGMDGEIAYVYAVSGRTAEAQQMLAKLLEQSARGSYHPVEIARVYLGLGDKDRAFEWLSKAVEQHALHLDLRSDSVFDPIRSDPRFHTLLQRMRLL